VTCSPQGANEPCVDILVEHEAQRRGL